MNRTEEQGCSFRQEREEQAKVVLGSRRNRGLPTAISETNSVGLFIELLQSFAHTNKRWKGIILKYLIKHRENLLDPRYPSTYILP